MKILFNQPYMTGKEFSYIAKAYSSGMLSGDGQYTAKCHAWLEQHTGAVKALLTNSCTAALEMAALLIDIQAGDEVIMPSYTFPSTANAFVLRGAVPVFVDIREDTLNIDEKLIAAAITSRTKAICAVHYGGVGCEMDTIIELADLYGLKVIEDAAHGIMATYKGRPLGSMGHFGTYSFHETKNLICGEGGALLVNDADYVRSSEIIREKGTDRSRFFRGEIDKYCWQDMGSSFLLGELSAAFLWAQMEAADGITQRRLALWRTYHKLLERLELDGLLQRPTIPEICSQNGHTYYVLLHDGETRDRVMSRLKSQGIHALLHYVPLHSSPAGLRFGRTHDNLSVTNDVSARILRLPLWMGLKIEQVEQVVVCLERSLK